MAKIRLTSPTFDASAQTITHASFSDVTLAGIQLIVNVTDQVIIYNFADPTKGGSLTGDVLTLEFDTTTMDDADQLMVLVEDGIAYQIPTGAATAANQASILAAVDGLEALLTTIDADTGAILAAVDTLETLVASTNTKLDTLINQTDGVEALLATIDADTDAIAADVAAIEVLATTIEANQDAQTAILTTIDADTSAVAATIQTQDAVYTPGSLGMVGGVRRDADTTPVSGDGDVHPFVFEETGRLKVASYPGSIPTYTDNITSNGDTVALDVSRYSNLTIYCTGTFSTVNVTFEGSIDAGVTWFAVQGVRTNANTVELTTGNLSAAPAYACDFSVNALTNFRVRATAFTSGTQVWRFSPGTYATEPIPAIQTHPVTGSGNFAVTMAANATTTPAKARDGVAGASDTGIPGWMIRRDTPTAVTPAAGDWEVPQISANGEQWVRLAGEVADDAAFTPATTRVVPVGFFADETATDSVDEGDAGAARMTLDRKQITTPYVHAAAGGWTPYKNLDVDESEDEIKGTAGKLGFIHVINLAATVRYLKIYNATAASVTVGTTVPVLTFPIPTFATTNGAGFTINFGDAGLQFSTAICVAATTGFADNDTGAPGANEVIFNAGYL